MGPVGQRLAEFFDSPRKRHTLALCYGRRRIGKSTLLSRLVRERDGFYWEAGQAQARTQLRQLGQALGDFVGVGPLALEDWNAALSALLRVGRDRPVPVVLDEFGYLVESDRSLPSLIAQHLGPAHNRDAAGRARVVLCGSAIGMMRSLTAGQAPLRGRVALEELMHPADFRGALDWYPAGIDHSTAMRLYSVIGGVVGYATDMVDADLPENADAFDPWVARRVLSPSAALHREATTLLAEDPELQSGLSVFHSILGQIANGAVSAGTIADGLGRSVPSLAPALNQLVQAGFVRRHEDPLRQRRPMYTLDDSFLQFHYAVLGPFGSQLRDRDPLELWQSSLRARFDSRVRGPVFEEAARTWVRRYASPETVGGEPETVGPSRAKVKKVSVELDVVVADGVDMDPADRRVRAVGEAKAGETITYAHVERLERARALLGPAAASAKLLLFGVTFNDRVREVAAGRSDVELIDLERLFNGS